jgi:hypothetical protein
MYGFVWIRMFDVRETTYRDGRDMLSKASRRINLIQMPEKAGNNRYQFNNKSYKRKQNIWNVLNN